MCRLIHWRYSSCGIGKIDVSEAALLGEDRRFDGSTLLRRLDDKNAWGCRGALLGLLGAAGYVDVNPKLALVVV